MGKYERTFEKVQGYFREIKYFLQKLFIDFPIKILIDF
jgi:hypothetical protein